MKSKLLLAFGISLVIVLGAFSAIANQRVSTKEKKATVQQELLVRMHENV